MFTTKYSKNRNSYAGKSKKKGLKFADGGRVPYPKTDDNMFFASGPDEKIIRAKRDLRTMMEEDAKSRGPDWPGINNYMAGEKTREIADEVRGRVGRPPGGGGKSKPWRSDD